MKIFPMNLTVSVPVQNEQGHSGVARNTYAHGRVLTQEEVAETVKQTAADLPAGMRVTDEPASIVAEFFVTDGLEGGNSGTADVAFNPGHVPTEDEIVAVLADIKPQLPDGLRPMTRHEAFLHVLAERTGISEVVALPNLGEGEEWHDPDTASVSIVQTQPWRLSAEPDDEDDIGLD